MGQSEWSGSCLGSSLTIDPSDHRSVLADSLKEGGFKLQEKAWPDYW